MNSKTIICSMLLMFLHVTNSYAILYDDDLQKHEAESLMALKSRISVDPHDSLANWNYNVTYNYCNWTGIICNKEHGTIMSINLTGMDLQGTISPFISNISGLMSLDLSMNELHGNIPSELGSLSSLQHLNLRRNILEGSIPSSLSNLTRLVALDLSTNTLTGNIPMELGSLKSLTLLYLHENMLSGTIPISLSNMSALEEMVLYTNKLTGSIPWEFCSKLSELRMLWLARNRLSGEIPSSLGNCSKLIRLLIDRNQLSGSIPMELARLSNLQQLKLVENNLHGAISSFLTALTNCTHLQELSLGDNVFGGVLPHSIGMFSKNLTLLYLGNSSLKGDIPREIGNLTGLTFLGMSLNFFTGTIPSLKKITNLERLQLNYNYLEGSIPEEFGQLKHLGSLSLGSNKLSGRIPESLGSLTELRRVYFAYNQLSGSIPASLGNCLNMERLDLSYNRLNGSIPREIGRLQNLQIYLNLSSNQLQGKLPPEIGGIPMVQAIDISSNNLSGNIPGTIGSCTDLEYLNLSRNALSSSIPISIGSLQSLIHLDLSYNNLSGIVPVEALKKLDQLALLDLSYNQLTGRIVNDSITANQTAKVYLVGNNGLCGSSYSFLHSCSKSRQTSVRLYLIIAFSIFSLLILMLLALIIIKRKRDHQNTRNLTTHVEQIINGNFTHEELAKATNGFAEASVIGRGSFGTVYKGTMSNGSIVAVKVLEIQNAHTTASFEAECKVLKKVRHRNLMRIVAACSKPDFKALVFRFMSNGSLERVLYDDDMQRLFCLEKRLNVAIDVAHAIEYLHHDFFTQVVHCDIKPANVLLDEDMTAYLTDFGISRLIETDSSTSLLSSMGVNGTIGYIAPEYGTGGRVYAPADVYGYGIMLLEMMTGKRPTDELFHGDLNLHKWVSMAYSESLMDIIHPQLMDGIEGDNVEESPYFKCIASLCHIGLLCSRNRPQERPTMKDVSYALHYIREDFIAGKK